VCFGGCPSQTLKPRKMYILNPVIFTRHTHIIHQNVQHDVVIDPMEYLSYSQHTFKDIRL
jgi:hypothetical protein